MALRGERNERWSEHMYDRRERGKMKREGKREKKRERRQGGKKKGTGLTLAVASTRAVSLTGVRVERSIL